MTYDETTQLDEAMKQAKLLNQVEHKRVQAVIDAHRYSRRDHAIFAFSFYAGLRACEIAALKVGDVFDAKGQVSDTIFLAAGQTKGDEANTIVPR
jgi:integrase/recombinase XerD